jgi:hypothetical protein
MPYHAIAFRDQRCGTSSHAAACVVARCRPGAQREWYDDYLDSSPGLFGDDLRLAASAYLGRVIGVSRMHTEFDRGCSLPGAPTSSWPLEVQRAQVDWYVRWMQEVAVSERCLSYCSTGWWEWRTR